MLTRLRLVFAMSWRFVLISTTTAPGLTAGSAHADPPVVRTSQGASADKQLDPQQAAGIQHESQNKLKQLALAMHNYHDLHGHFPPAVVLGPDAKTPHSWRVELLPFLDEQRLYDQYRQNEPWDSPHNKLILRQMPEVFRSPFADVKSTNSCYYALVGRGTIFEGTKGIRIQEITDGTTRTLMFVEAKREIPWTKPADIPFDPEKPVPQLGGFVKGRFAAACADASAHIFRFEDFKGNDLKWAIMRNDGRPFDLP
ncbi:MAG TPA: DUF1559 domain-containing protein [Planctomycetaceae bacterium]|nr:DUF1559 domain-containing protein [Planctomycetaceae bacterium]